MDGKENGSFAGRLVGALIVAAALWIWVDNIVSNPTKAETYLPVVTTPDLTISAMATAEFVFSRASVPSGKVDWIALRNDCIGDLYFGLRGKGVYIPTLATKDLVYPIYLPGITTTQGASRERSAFSGPFRAYSIVVSNASTSACTFQALAGEKIED